ncbi:hypothetical protein B7R21_06240 [Subtercola boreus]|uniref:Uncharacterized protein n=1 Tax=Subtercola boreus TaxID=120213 RepID=A0A3E0VXT4_9MICO|nr:hypothetical protein [Subtercola boreus]RFA14541.1 hypothetical protein B7R21_06240 [Subtercola boreus]
MEDEGFLAISNEMLRALGMVVVAAGRLEAGMIAVGTHMGLKSPRDLPFRELSNRIIKRVEAVGVPPWSTADGEAVTAWAIEARDSMAKRDPLIHASYGLRGEAFSPTTVKIHLRPNSMRDLSAAEAEELAQHLSVLATRSMTHSTNLLLRIAPDQWAPVYWKEGEIGVHHASEPHFPPFKESPFIGPDGALDGAALDKAVGRWPRLPAASVDEPY